MSHPSDNPWLDSHDAYWQSQSDDRAGAVVVDTEHYRVGPVVDYRDGAGFGGQLFRLRDIATGEITETRNLWHQGTIPPAWRDRLPSTHEFLPVDGPTGDAS